MKQWSAIAPAVILPKIIASKNKTGGPPIAKPAVSSINGVVWKPLGPSGITAGSSIWNGRVDAIAISPTNPSVIYLGATDGGIWKTIDAGADWTPLLDHQAMLAIGEPSAIAIDPNNTDTIYAGSSSYFKDTGAQGPRSTRRSEF